MKTNKIGLGSLNLEGLKVTVLLQKGVVLERGRTNNNIKQQTGRSVYLTRSDGTYATWGGGATDRKSQDAETKALVECVSREPARKG